MKKVLGTILSESRVIRLLAGIFLLRRLESCAVTGKAVIMINENNMSRATLKQTIL